MPVVKSKVIASHDLKRLAATPGKHSDGSNLILQVARPSSAIWVYRYSLHGRRREISIGPLRQIGLAQARERARELAYEIAQGIDPIDARKAARTKAEKDAAGRVLLRDYTKGFIERNRSRWRSEKHAAQWSSSIRDFAQPLLKKPIGEIKPRDVADALKPRWQSHNETSARVLQRLHRIFDEIAGAGIRPDNPCNKAALAPLLPVIERKVKHHDMMPVDLAPDFMARLRERDAIEARALELLILTAARMNELVGMKASEIDEHERIWRVPGSRTKSGREHEIPLCDRAMHIVKTTPREHASKYVFAHSSKRGQPISPQALRRVNKAISDAMDVKATPHGWRATFRSWAEERAKAPHVVAELALGHVQPDAVVKAYQRSKLLDDRRELMDKWDRYLRDERGKVVALKGGRRPR